MQTKLLKILEIIKSFLLTKKVGYVRINMKEGGITNINIKESVKL